MLTKDDIIGTDNLFSFYFFAPLRPCVTLFCHEDSRGTNDDIIGTDNLFSFYFFAPLRLCVTLFCHEDSSSQRMILLAPIIYFHFISLRLCDFA